MDLRREIRSLSRQSVLLALSGVVLAAAGPQGMPSIPANDLVREAVANEVKNTTGGERFMYRMRKVTPDRVELKEYVETNMGTVARLIAYNDKPLTADMQTKENARLQGLLDNPDLQRERQKRQKEDEQRVHRMLGALPDAFLYEYDGMETGKNGQAVARLKFQPNQQFQPSTRELKVYEGMQGTMWIELAGRRLVKITAQLFRDVDFGWGILGRLYKGGHFDIEQSDLGGGRWETTYMNLDFNGKVLMFKSLRIRDTQTLSEFRKVAPNLTLAQGIDMLRSIDPNKIVVAQEKAAPPRAQQ